MTGRLAIVVGVDGAGKSAVVRRLAELGFATSHWRMLRQVDERWAERVDTASKQIRELRGTERLALIRELVDGEWNACIRPRLAANQDVVCDGFYVRFLAKEAVYGECDVSELARMSPLSGGELVVLIDTPVVVVVERKRGQPISPYECLTGPEDFAEFQTRQRAQLLTTILSWDHVVVDGARAEDIVASAVQRILVGRGFVPAVPR